jgi:transcription elongation factor S-II
MVDAGPREKAEAMISSALAGAMSKVGSTEATGQRKKRSDGSKHGRELAHAIERALFIRHGEANQEYRAWCRAFIFNLRDPRNITFSSSVVDGSLSASQLVGLEPHEMASASQKEERRRVQRRLAKSAIEMQAAGQGHDSTAYICRECHANETRVRIVGGRRDVGKCETWGSKDRPAAVYEVTCMKCRHRWFREDA